MRKILKWAGLLIGGLLIVGVATLLIINRPLPDGATGPKADLLARKMLDAINKEAWDSTHYVRWVFPGGHQYVWDKFRQYVQVEWGDKKVLLRTTTQAGKAWQGGEEKQGAAAEALLQTAWSFFCNDSFWLNAPAKAFDPGVTRSLAPLEGGEQGLLVSYSTGGVTPGDAYLWKLDENGLPLSWRMWVAVLPVGGLKTSWESWTELETGARVATQHKIGFITLELSDIKGGNSLQAVGLSKDPFKLLD